MTSDSRTQEIIKIKVIYGQVLGVTVVRGFAKLSDLARISKPDIYDAQTNPTGTQRDLSIKHAREAYEYIKRTNLGYWPELFLSARIMKGITFMPDKQDSSFGTLILNVTEITASKNIVISRVDGNHRLYFANSEETNTPPILKNVSFCLALDLSENDEIILFRDINANQKSMNTSHLDNIQARLTEEDILKRDQPPLYIARKLGRDESSPLCGLVYEGGRKIPGSDIPLRTLKTGIEYMFSRPTKLTALRDADAQYRVIRNYFDAVKLWQPFAWNEPKKYITLRGAGLWGICFIGAEVIDRALGKAKFSSGDMLEILTSGRKWDWSTKGNFAGLSGRGGAVQISNRVTAEFQEQGISMKSLYDQIMSNE